MEVQIRDIEGEMSNLLQEEHSQQVKICILGAQSVGKTSLIQQFVCNRFSETYVPTMKRNYYHPSVIINEHMYEVKIIDCPVIHYYPINSLCEWSDFRGYGLRSATAFVLVFDITSEETFQYVRDLHEQIIEGKRNAGYDVPVFVVANKQDLTISEEDKFTHHKREIANIVKKQWKCSYIECSAKYNWHVMTIFKELMRAVDTIDYSNKPASTRMQNALCRDKCVIL